MNTEKEVEHDYGSSISFLASIQQMCALFGGFAFSGITIVITLGDPSTLLAQIILFIMFMSMGLFMGAVYELNNMKNLVCLDSPKQIIPIYPARWRRINTLMSIGGWAIQFSINLMFLLRNLIPLFILSIGITLFWFVWGYLRGWKPVEEELRRKGILR